LSLVNPKEKNMSKFNSSHTSRVQRASKTPRPVVVVASGGEVFIGKRLSDAYIWIEAEKMYPEEAANEAVYGTPVKR
jgi:hypothetical protein